MKRNPGYLLSEVGKLAGAGFPLTILVADPNISRRSPSPARADAVAAPPPAAMPVSAVTVTTPMSAMTVPVSAVVSIMMIAAVMVAAVMTAAVMTAAVMTTAVMTTAVMAATMMTTAVVTTTAVAAMRHRIRWERQRCRHRGDVGYFSSCPRFPRASTSWMLN